MKKANISLIAFLFAKLSLEHIFSLGFQGPKKHEHFEYHTMNTSAESLSRTVSRKIE